MLPRWIGLFLLAASWRITDACSCAPEHPQSQFCSSDFVIVGRVQNIHKKENGSISHQVKIRNILKASPKAMLVLKQGRIHTPGMDSMCSVKMNPRETYVITGRIMHLQAHTNLCWYVKKWREVTPRQRKGFRLLYKQGCTCKVRVSFSSGPLRSRSRNTCMSGFDDCYERHGICLHDSQHKCRWTRAPALTRCLQTQNSNGTMT